VVAKRPNKRDKIQGGSKNKNKKEMEWNIYSLYKQLPFLLF
jgi:hypothetical protein